METVNYFGYGSNMASQVLRGRRGVVPVQTRPAILPDHRLAFNTPGFFVIEPAFANAEFEGAGFAMHGALVTVSSSDFDRICRTEGVPFGYQVKDVEVIPYSPGLEHLTRAEWETMERCPAKTLVYGRSSLDLPPSRRYIRLLREGAAEVGLAESWQRKLTDIRPLV